jgi:hypothetical protein
MSYLQAYSARSIIAASWRMYFREWLTLFLIYLAPLLVAHILNSSIKDTGTPGAVIGGFSVFFASMFVTFPTTVAVSEICLDIKPTVGRSYRRAFAQPGKLIGSYLLAMVIILVGFLVLIIPGLVFSVWYTFIAPAVVLESLAGRAALKRSRELGRGYYLRNFGILFLGILLVMVLTLLLSLLIGVAFGIVAHFLGIGLGLAEFLGGVCGLVMAPPFSILTVLLYYDMRARKEGYAAAQLAEDLRF